MKSLPFTHTYTNSSLCILLRKFTNTQLVNNVFREIEQVFSASQSEIALRSNTNISHEACQGLLVAMSTSVVARESVSSLFYCFFYCHMVQLYNVQPIWKNMKF